MRIPRIDSSRELTRFRLYAPFVRLLEAHNFVTGEYGGESWQALGKYGQTTPLLPNLVQLTLMAPDLIKSQQQLLWIRMFLAPTVLELQVVRPNDHFPSISLPMALYLLRHISMIAPAIQRLFLIIESEIHDDFPLDNDLDIAWSWEPPLHDCLRSLTTLRELTCTDMIFVPQTISAIARLSNLDVLNIWVDGMDPSIMLYENQKCIPANPFPSLRQLSIRWADAGTVFTTFKCLTLQNVSSLRLGIEHRAEDEEIMAGDSWEDQLVELIAKSCPRLTDLRIDFNGYPKPRNLLKPSESGNTAVMAMSKLQLDSLYISSALLGDMGESFPIQNSIYNASYLMIAWPKITKIHLPQHWGHFNCLYEFSQLPNLQELTLRLGLDYANFDGDMGFNYRDNLDELPTGSSPLRTLGASWLTNTSEVGAKPTARTLLHFWPNLERITFRLDPDDPAEHEDYPAVLADIDETNEAIKKFRVSKLNGTEISSDEDEDIEQSESYSELGGAPAEGK
ncbi:hypothetical protein FRC12_004844 [Ceratobasidium sp. 428]|nr:hypothetical protein FRC12_004844 [Ceratobasidium sp. 428]